MLAFLEFGFIFNNFVAFLAEYWDIPVSCAKHFRDFWGVCCNFLPMWSNFSCIRTLHFLFDFRLFTDPVSLNLLVNFLMVSAEGTGVLETLFEIYIYFHTHFLCLLYTYKVCLKSLVNGVISERQLGACMCACEWFFRDMGTIDTQNGLHVTSSVNRQQPV